MAVLPLAKLFGVFARQVSKPVASALQERAKTDPYLRRQCIGVGQWLHWASVRILQSSVGRGPEHHVLRTTAYWADAGGPGGASAEALEAAGSLRRSQAVTLLKEGTGPLPPEQSAGPMQLLEWRGKENQKVRGWIRKQAEDGRDAIRLAGVQPLADEAALDRGSVFVGESFVFGVASLVVLEEYVRQGRKSERQEAASAQKRLDEQLERERAVAERDRRLDQLESEVRELRAACERLHADCESALKGGHGSSASPRPSWWHWLRL